MSAPHRISYEHGWGTRGPRRVVNFYVERKPTNAEVVAILRRRVSPSASLEWLAPHNSGLVVVAPLEFEAI